MSRFTLPNPVSGLRRTVSNLINRTRDTATRVASQVVRGAEHNMSRKYPGPRPPPPRTPSVRKLRNSPERPENPPFVDLAEEPISSAQRLSEDSSEGSLEQKSYLEKLKIAYIQKIMRQYDCEYVPFEDYEKLDHFLPYSGFWKNDEPFLEGTFHIGNDSVNVTWNNNAPEGKPMIATFVSICRPMGYTTELISFSQRINSSTVCSDDFLDYVGLKHSEKDLDDFLAKINTSKETVRIYASIHGRILPKMRGKLSTVPVDVIRFMGAPCGVINRVHFPSKISRLYRSYQEELDEWAEESYVNEVLELREEHCEELKEVEQIYSAKKAIDRSFRYDEDEDWLRSKKYLDVCSVNKKVKETYKKGTEMFDKEFDGDYPTGLNVLLLIDQKGNKVNLITIRKNWYLFEILRMLSDCKQVILLDNSCSEGEGYTQEEYDKHGGRKRRTHRKKS